MEIEGILLDIEGTVGPISFVHEVLFPYSQERLLEFLKNNPLEDELKEKILAENIKDFERGIFPKINNPNSPEEFNAYLQFLIREDRKFGALKYIQGKIWKEGFELGDIRSELFEDVPKFLEKLKSKNKKIYIYSSGSVDAQRLYFKYSIFGDLTKFLDGYFDTEVGSKKEPSSYIIISKLTATPVEKLAFFTDSLEEALAAKNAGIIEIYILNRPGNKPTEPHNFPILNSLLSFF